MGFHLKKFFSYYKPYLPLFIAVMACAILSASITLIFPLLTRYITGTVLEKNISNALPEILKTGAIMLGLIALHASSTFFFDYYGHAMGAMMERDLRRELFEHVQKLSFTFFDNQKTGRLMTRITNDLHLLAELYHHGPEDYLIYIVKFFGAFIVLMTINVKLALIIFAFLPILCAFSFHFFRRMNRALKESYERIGDVNAQVEDTLSGIRVVKSFANEKLEIRKFQHENNRFLDSRKTIYKNEAWHYDGINAIIQLITVAVVVFGGISILNTSLNLPDLLTFLLYIGSITEPIQKLAFSTMQFQEGIAGFQRFMEIMEIEPDIQDSSDAVELVNGNVRGHIQFKNVSFKYRDDHEYVLKGISLDIDAGDYIALVGTSGVGKTTLCSLIPRFYEINEGEIRLDGINIKDIKLSSLRRNIGVVQQDIYLFAGTVMENIRYGKPDASDEEIIEAAKKANAHDFIMALPDGYDTDIGQRGVRLSGGQKQRISIARVFLKNPPILILDEATSSLDNESERVIQDSLERLAKNRTTIVIAHRLSTIRNAKKIWVLTEQGICEQGTHDELMAKDGIYSHLYSMQFSDPSSNMKHTTLL